MKNFSYVQRSKFHKSSMIKLSFPALSHEEKSNIEKYAAKLGYQFVYDEEAKKCVIRNDAVKKVAYIQKPTKDIFAVFNSRKENISESIVLTKLLEDNAVKLPMSLFRIVCGIEELEVVI